MDFWRMLLYALLSDNGIKPEDRPKELQKLPMEAFELSCKDYLSTSSEMQRAMQELIKGNQDYMEYVDAFFGNNITEEGIVDHKKYLKEQLNYAQDDVDQLKDLNETMDTMKHLEKTLIQMKSLKIWQEKANSFLKESDYQNFAVNDIKSNNKEDMEHDEYLKQFNMLKWYMTEEMNSYMALVNELQKIWNKVGIDIDP